MNRILPLLLISMLFGFHGYSQETEEIATPKEQVPYSGKNELKLNGMYLLIGFPELSYERILNDESALGISVNFSIDDIEIDFMAIPYYRIYFGKKPAAGFFVEGNAAFYVVDDEEYTYYNGSTYEVKTENEIGAGIGLAVGSKFMTESGWVFEVFGGAGRNFLGSDNISVAYPRFGLTVGKRF
ncbi:hypothetical protein VS868_07785 [Salinimicrobium sp. 3283s]|uniref:hypothetical protein n=1 Tax=Salinimicrobium sp. 3283s TaxID=3114359 RepID=UPI0031E6FF74